VHGGFAIAINGIYIGAKIEGQLRGFKDFGFRSGYFIGGSLSDADSARGQEWRAVIGIWEQRIRL
jgi:hypothetical protein